MRVGRGCRAAARRGPTRPDPTTVHEIASLSRRAAVAGPISDLDETRDAISNSRSRRPTRDTSRLDERLRSICERETEGTRRTETNIDTRREQRINIRPPFSFLRSALRGAARRSGNGSGRVSTGAALAMQMPSHCTIA